MPALRALTLLLALTLPPPGEARAEILLVCHPQAAVEEITRAQAVGLYMGRDRDLPGGIAAKPIDMVAGAAPRAGFYQALVRRSEAQVDAWWARLVFSGQTNPLPQVATVEEMVTAVQADRSAIGFIHASDLPPDLKVLLRLAVDEP